MYTHHFPVVIDLLLASLNKRQAEVIIERLLETFVSSRDIECAELSRGEGLEKKMVINDSSLFALPSSLWSTFKDIKEGKQPKWEIRSELGSKALMDCILDSIDSFLSKHRQL